MLSLNFELSYNLTGEGECVSSPIDVKPTFNGKNKQLSEITCLFYVTPLFLLGTEKCLLVGKNYFAFIDIYKYETNFCNYQTTSC
jgi:hypothetical protein